MIDRLSATLADRYMVEREIGAGGMATVYLARDIKHNRQVALKVLRPELAAVLGTERFLSEINVTAKLQHPHLLPLFDSGEANGLLFYVMPYIEGESLRARLERERQLPVDEAVRITVAVASALDYAHRHNVIHRDLKPENILLHDGMPLIADFGIALAVSNAGGTRLTQTGLSLGTPQYVSPEQATGDSVVDGRSDIYALGAVTYEMLAGEPPHQGNTAQAIISRVLTENPRPLTTVRRAVPVHVQGAVHCALEKLPADRFSTASEFAEALQGKRVLTRPSAVATAPGERTWQRVAIVTSAIAVLALAMAIWQATRPLAPVSATRAQFTLELPPEAGLNSTGPRNNIAISPDGSQIVYLGDKARPRLHLRTLDDMTPRPIPGTDGGNAPKFSPDGQWIAFLADGALKKIRLAGGTPITLLDSVSTYDWGDGDVILLSRLPGVPRPRGIWRMSAAGGAAQPLPIDTSEIGGALGAPKVLPGGKHALFGIARPDRAFEIAAVPLSGGKPVLLGVQGRTANYANSGHLLFTTAREIMAVPFDAQRLRVTGTAVPVLTDVSIKAGIVAEYAVARNGTLVYVPGRGELELVQASREGGRRALLRSDESMSYSRWSPDGRRIALTMGPPPRGSDIFVLEIASNTLNQLTNDQRSMAPVWLPDGRTVVWTTIDSAGRRLYAQPWDASRAAEILVDSALFVEVAPSGKFLLTSLAADSSVITVVHLDGTGKRSVLGGAPGRKVQPRFSPDGRWIAYASSRTSGGEVYVEPFEGPSARYQISAGGGTEPVWAPNGKELFYRRGEVLMVAKITTTPEFAVLSRDTLFAKGGPAGIGSATYDVSADGNHFLFTTRATADRNPVVVIGWFDELRARTAQTPKK